LDQQLARQRKINRQLRRAQQQRDDEDQSAAAAVAATAAAHVDILTSQVRLSKTSDAISVMIQDRCINQGGQYPLKVLDFYRAMHDVCT